MTVEEANPASTDTVASDPDDLTAAAAALVTGLVHEPWGRSSPSVYETGRLVSLAPWLTGHARRLRFLLDTQRRDGTWGPPDPGYALVPTLSASEALLSTLRPHERLRPYCPLHTEIVRAVGRALRTLARRLDGSKAADYPDVPAIEHITPVLVEQINGHLDRLRPHAPGALALWCPSGRLSPPAGMDGAVVAAVRDHLGTGGAVPPKMLHALEIAGPVAGRARAVRPVSIPIPARPVPGPEDERKTFATVGASTAATAAWLGGPRAAQGVRTAHCGRGPRDEAPVRRYLEAAVEQHDGPVPVTVPMTNFERGWVLSWLARAGIPLSVPPELLGQMRAALGEDGAPGGPGLPRDADTSSGLLYALSLLGEPHPPDLLWQYETDTHFCSWPGENGRSVTTNAHVLEAFGHYLQCADTGPRKRYVATIRKVTSWLIDRQKEDGRWEDRWHASPMYATACCALALNAFGGPESADAVDRAAGWVLDGQLADGSWGRWGGTAEETAYAVQILTLPRAGRDPARTAAVGRAVRRGTAYLRAAVRTASTSGFGDIDSDKPPLWHDKDLYRPITIVQAAVLSALHLARYEVADIHVSRK
ncbi:squalene-hopene cyclase-like protein [Actinomadura pelletieri DSM 43383]|uniref:Squalene-hopene cyclase-like protein n=1 Tax=Actinomadura pelletieri DSM 43383 TaxID=1120940 RepID=A0A495QG65_9ACTN|nr:prenyltransferase/squalene oxidase repeat-containing protein [Actinomadura pelletieri]RKS70849.1 squalene-hopene cyclase-like protein [Actinomadura pelletieri DSM 43383]